MLFRSPGGPLRPPLPPGSSLTTPGHLSQVSSLTPAGSGPPCPPKVWARPASTQSSPGAQQGLRRGRVVKLQFISVDTEAQETGEPPCLPPKRLLTIGVSFPRPLTPHSHPRLSPPCCLQKLVPHSSHPHAPIPGPLHVLSSRKVLPTTTPGPPRLQRGYPDGHIYSCLLISRVTLHTCSHVTL